MIWCHRKRFQLLFSRRGPFFKKNRFISRICQPCLTSNRNWTLVPEKQWHFCRYSAGVLYNFCFIFLFFHFTVFFVFISFSSRIFLNFLFFSITFLIIYCSLSLFFSSIPHFSIRIRHRQVSGPRFADTLQGK